MEQKPTPPSGAPAPEEPRLLDRVRTAIRRRHYSYRTEQAHVHWIKRFIHFHGLRHPRELGEAAVTAFLNSLVADRGVAAATQNQALSSLLFLYKKRPACFTTVACALLAGGCGPPICQSRTVDHIYRWSRF